MIERPAYASLIHRRLETNPVVSLLGPRQVGKTTLARKIAGGLPSPHFFDRENPVDASRLREPMTALDSLEGLVVIDEVQRQPELFPLLRVLAGGKVFLTGVEDGRLATLVLDAQSGKVLCERLAPEVPLERGHAANSAAASTPAMDENSLCERTGEAVLCFRRSGPE